MKPLFLITGLLFYAFQIIAQPTIPPPPQSDEIILDAGTTGSADPGDRVRYKVTIQNTGNTAATLMQLNAAIDSRTTLVPGSFRTSPLAIADAYTVTGNVGINVPAANGLKANDFDDNIALLTITAGTFATPHGSIAILSDGSFTYTPTAGYTGSDTYTYTLNDGNGVGAGVPTTDMAAVTFTISNLIWFVDNTGGGTGGAGSLASPFKTLGDLNASSGPLAGHLIFIKNTGTNYNGGIILKDNQIVFGTGHTGGANLANVLPFSLAANSVTLPAINGTRPIITNTVSGDGVTLASGNTLRGFDVGACADFGMDNTGTNTIGNLILSEVGINNTSGGGFDASHGTGASMNAVFISISSTGGTNGIDLTNAAGTFTVNGGTITNPTGTGILISGGSVTFSTNSVVTDNSGFAIDVDNHDSNNVTFSGNITSTATGIRVQNCGGGTILFSGSSKNLTTTSNAGVTLSANAGANINFTNGGLVISTTTGIGFIATGGALGISVQGAGNIITSSSATALSVIGTIIGSGNLNFTSISSGNNTAAADPALGIELNATGTGALIVTGNGGGSNDGSGGTVQFTTGNGITLFGTSNVSLGYMNINNTGDIGVLVQNASTFTINRCNLNNNGNSTSDDGMLIGSTTGTTINGVTGNLTISNTAMSGSAHNHVHIRNVSGTLSNLTVTGSSFNNLNDVTGANGFLFEASNTAIVTTASMTSCTISNNSPQRGLEVQAHDNANIQSFTVQTSTFNDNGLHISFSQDGASSSYFKILNNTSMLNGNPLHAINIASSATSTGGVFQGRIEGNIIGNNAVAGSGSTTGGGIRMFMQGLTRGIFLINNNQIYECPNGRGLEVTSGSFAVNGVDVTITNNTIDHINLPYNPGSSNFPLAAIYMVADNTTGSGNGTLRADVRGNNVNLPGGSYDYPTFSGTDPWMYFYEEPGLGTSLLLDNPPTPAASAAAELSATNTGPTGASAAVGLITGTIQTPP